jgi:CheY-like chemotaxis protein
MGRLAAGVAHDFNNLLTSILGFGHILRETLPAGSAEQDYAAQIVQAGERAAELVRRMLAFSAQAPPKLGEIDLHEAIRAREADLRERLGPGIELCLDLHGPGPRVRLDAERWNDLLDQLARNAADAMPGGGRWEVRSVSLPEKWVRLEFADTGEGMDAATLTRIFEPFFSTRETHARPGLGLSIVYVTVEQLGGVIAVESQPGQGTRFLITLPEADAEGADEAQGPLPTGAGERILLVDDDEPVRRLFHHLLTSLGYGVREASGVAEALAALEADPEPFHLLLTDLALPGLPVARLVAEIQSRHPGCAVLYTSGYAPDTLPADRRLPATANFLPKPCTREVLARMVREALDAPARAALAPRVK